MRRRFLLRRLFRTRAAEISNDGFDFAVGRWRVRVREGLVANEGHEHRLEPRVMAVLACLAERPGRIVSKDELVREVWDGVAVSDTAIVRSIVQLRKCLEDDARNPRFVETVPKRGYRLIAEVRRPVPDEVSQAKTEPRRFRAPRYLAASVLLIATAFWLRPSSTSNPVIAIEPLHELDTLASQEQWGSSLTVEVVASLVGADIAVVMAPRGSARTRATVPVLSGTVQREGEKARVSCSISDTTTGRVLCAGACSVSVGDRLEAQRTVAAEITSSVKKLFEPR